MRRVPKAFRLITVAASVTLTALTVIPTSSASTDERATHPRSLSANAVLAAETVRQPRPYRSALNRSWIAFVSDHDSVNLGTPQELTNDEVYLLNPRSGRTVRITNNPAT